MTRQPAQHIQASLRRRRGIGVALWSAVIVAAGAWMMLQALAQQPDPSPSTSPPPPPVLGQQHPAGDAAEPTLKPPIGVVAEAQLTSVELAWVPDPASTVYPDAYDVLYWPDTPAGFALRKRLYATPQPGRIARIENLEPGTDYLIAVRAASQRVLDLERRGDFSLSRLSQPVRVRTQPNPRLVLLAAAGGRDSRAVFRLDYTDLDTGERHSFPVVTHVGNEIRRRVEINGREQVLAPGYKLMETLRVPYRTFSHETQEDGWHTLPLASGEPPHDELDNTPFNLRLPRRITPVAPAARTRQAVRLQNLATYEERLLIAEHP